MATTSYSYPQCQEPERHKISWIKPWDSVINAFPGVKIQSALTDYPAQLLASRLRVVGMLLGALPLVRWLVWRWLNRPVAGRLYSFLAVKG
jgi:hypothetical protein